MSFLLFNIRTGEKKLCPTTHKRIGAVPIPGSPIPDRPERGSQTDQDEASGLTGTRLPNVPPLIKAVPRSPDAGTGPRNNPPGKSPCRSRWSHSPSRSPDPSAAHSGQPGCRPNRIVPGKSPDPSPCHNPRDDKWQRRNGRWRNNRNNTSGSPARQASSTSYRQSG